MLHKIYYIVVMQHMTDNAVRNVTIFCVARQNAIEFFRAMAFEKEKLREMSSMYQKKYTLLFERKFL